MTQDAEANRRSASQLNSWFVGEHSS